MLLPFRIRERIIERSRKQGKAIANSVLWEVISYETANQVMMKRASSCVISKHCNLLWTQRETYSYVMYAARDIVKSVEFTITANHEQKHVSKQVRPMIPVHARRNNPLRGFTWVIKYNRHGTVQQTWKQDCAFKIYSKLFYTIYNKFWNIIIANLNTSEYSRHLKKIRL